MRTDLLTVPRCVAATAAFFACATDVASAEVTYPVARWTQKAPAELGMDAAVLQQVGARLGGRGWIAKDGYAVASWGDPKKKGDWYSSVKPVFSTLLFFAIEEGRIPGVRHRIKDLGWPLSEEDAAMEFHHLANMTSGYARAEKPGQAWAYNDYAIQLYQKSLFEKVFRARPAAVMTTASRLGPLAFQDGVTFRRDKPRLMMSVRDFARIAWFWSNKGQWRGKQLLPRKYFDTYMRPQTPKNLPPTAAAGKDYLGIGTFGGGSAHFTNFGAGIYGYNWWFNAQGGLHPDRLTWPDAPGDTMMTIGARGNNAVIIPSRNLVMTSAAGKWGNLAAGNADSRYNQILKLLVSADHKR